VTFTFRVAGLPTNAFYEIDFGDKSAIANPVPYTANTTVSVTRVYSSGGFFTLKLTVYNSLSNVTTYQDVIYNYKLRSSNKSVSFNLFYF
jgi:hypothetical protein